MSSPMDEHVPDRSHYDARYLSGWRLHSIAEQASLALEVAPRSALEIGIGAGLSVAMLRAVGVAVTTVDVQAELEPDIVADVRALPLADGSHDVVICCQVLEHLPFSDFAKAARELRRVARRRLVLSLPDIERQLRLAFRMPIIGGGRFDCSFRAPRVSADWRRERLEGMGHYWEIGVDGIRPRDISSTLKSVGFGSVRSHRLQAEGWHRFFVAE
jgi:ubiquinone/menaquinone biosynthesis C-methylase UbiE